MLMAVVAIIWGEYMKFILPCWNLGIEMVTDIIAKFAKSHEKRLQGHNSIEASRLNVNNITRRLKRKKSFELVGR
jgi:hypothetical protein